MIMQVQYLNIILTSVLTTALTFISLRFVFGKLAKGLSGLTHLGAKFAGDASGLSRASKAVQEETAQGILNSPQLAGIKMIADQAGFDIDGMIEDHGAVPTLSGVTQLLQMLGISPEKLLSEGLGGIAKGLLGKGDSSTQGSLP